MPTATQLLCLPCLLTDMDSGCLLCYAYLHTAQLVVMLHLQGRPARTINITISSM